MALQAKNRKTIAKQKKIRVLLRAWGSLVAPVVCGPDRGSSCAPPGPSACNNPSMQWCSPWKVAKFVLWCSFSPQVKILLVTLRVGIDLDREIALDWFVLQTQLQDQTFWSVLRTALIFHVEKIGKKKVLMSNSQFTSFPLASVKVRVWK